MSRLLLLSAFSLSLQLLMIPCHCIVEPTSSTLAISQGTGIVCLIKAGWLNHGIYCTKVEESNGAIPSFPPTHVFNYIYGGHDYICTFRSGDTYFYCWDGISEQVDRVNSGPTALIDGLSVGKGYIASIDGDTIQWWKHGWHSHSRSCTDFPDFPKSVKGVFHSLTSSDVFTCAIDGTHKVHCWGPHANLIMVRFIGVPMRSVTAGGSRMCGLNMTGQLLCSGAHLNVPPGEDFEFSSIAVGSMHTCAIRRKERTVICWGRYGSYFPMGTTRFVFLVGGGDLTCGLTADALTVVCWGLRGRNLFVVTLSLPKILPSVCTPDETFGSCGIYPQLGNQRGGPGKGPDMLEHFELLQPPSLTTWEWMGKCWFVFTIFKALIAIVDCLRFGWGAENNAVPLGEENLFHPDNQGLLPPVPQENNAVLEEEYLLGPAVDPVINALLEEEDLLGPPVPDENNVALPEENLLEPAVQPEINAPQQGQHEIVELPPEEGLAGPTNPGTGSTENLLVQQGGAAPSDLGGLQVFSYKDLKAAIRRFLVWRTQLGVGGKGVKLYRGQLDGYNVLAYHGAVYRGRLTDGRLVAVKHCTAYMETPGLPFWETTVNAELETLSKCNHANIVKLIGYCKEKSDLWISVFEYMERKDLYRLLHPTRWQRKSHLFNSWRMRIKILLDTAKGIKYLHREANPRIIHLDIKSSNILVSDDWVAKLSNFGFSVFGPEEGRMYVEFDWSIRIGTMGYRQPPSHRPTIHRRNGIYPVPYVTPQYDVYSFGVVMLEVITGKEPYNEREAVHLASLRFTRENIGSVLDRRLRTPVGREMQALERVGELAQHCLGRYNPSISEVVVRLENASALFDPPVEGAGNN